MLTMINPLNLCHGCREGVNRKKFFLFILKHNLPPAKNTPLKKNSPVQPMILDIRSPYVTVRQVTKSRFGPLLFWANFFKGFKKHLVAWKGFNTGHA